MELQYYLIGVSKIKYKNVLNFPTSKLVGTSCSPQKNYMKNKKSKKYAYIVLKENNNIFIWYNNWSTRLNNWKDAAAEMTVWCNAPVYLP